MPPGSRVSRWYTGFALQLVNTLVLFALLNVLACGVRALWRGGEEPERLALLGRDRLEQIYPGWSEPDVRELLREDVVESEFETYTQFRPLERSGRFVNVTPQGFRDGAAQRPWPPPGDAQVVFVFGGSTTYGAGLPDAETIPSRLQQHLARCAPDLALYNFGRPHYFSTQERVLFEQLLAAAEVPALAVFIDGLNDFYHWDGAPHGSSVLAGAVRHARDPDGAGAAALDLLRRLPLVRVAAALARRGGAEEVATSEPPLDAAETAKAVIERWAANVRLADAAARAHGARALFVWQPVPTHRYDLEAHALARGKLDYFRGHARSHYGYAAMEQLRGALALPPDVLWLDGIQENRAENLYLDAVHYTAAFSDEIAKRIADDVLARGLLRCAR